MLDIKILDIKKVYIYIYIQQDLNNELKKHFKY